MANGSSGRMGFAIAYAAIAAGHEVRMILGPTELEPPAQLESLDRVVSARDMHTAALAAFDGADIAFGVAAVADFRPARYRAGKPAKHEVDTTIELVPNPDVIASLGEVKADRTVVGFALEADGERGDALRKARQKLDRKHLDACVLNAPAAMGARSNAVTLVWGDDRPDEALPRMSKDRLGIELVERVVAWHEGRRTRKQP